MRQLAMDVTVQASFLLLMSANFMQWRKATIIYPVCMSNKYFISPDLEDPFSASLDEKFGESFPGERLATYLTLISSYHSISNIMQMGADQYDQSQEHLADVIVWCLKHMVIVQKHHYIVLFICSDKPTELPDPIKTFKPKKDIITRIREECKPGESIIDFMNMACLEGFDSNPPNPSATEEELLSIFKPEEREIIKQIDYSLEDLNLFCRLAPWFNGRNHVEAVMYSNNILRDTLLVIVHKFKSVLFHYEFEDPDLRHHFKFLKDIGQETNENDGIAFPVWEGADVPHLGDPLPEPIDIQAMMGNLVLPDEGKSQDN